MQPFTLTGITANDVRNADREQYTRLATLLAADLCPQGVFEVLLAAEIVRASWRLQRCARQDELTTGGADRTDLDRVRAHANTTIRRNTAELRRLQTQRLVQDELGLHLPRLTTLKEYFQLTASRKTPKPAPVEPEKRKDEANSAQAGTPDPAAVANMEDRLFSAIVKEEKSQLKGLPESEEIKIRTQSQPRNEPCRCGSGQKYKRCCGHWAKSA